MSSLWQRLGSWLFGPGEDAAHLQLPPGSAGDAGHIDAGAGEPTHLRHEEEMWLEGLVRDVRAGQNLDSIGASEFWQRIDGLWRRGHERLAIEWVDKFLAATATPPGARQTLRARLVEFYDQRSELAAAAPHLEELIDSEEHALRAHYLLAEHYRRQGDEVRALRHYEAVLARDVNYPNVRARLERLRMSRGQAAPVPMGQTIAGVEASGVAAGARYHLVRELGRGATGVVYLSRDVELERDVAIKLLHPHLSAANRARACARFFEEARISASLRHPNIMAVLDLDERTRRIVMELAAGGTLRQVLRERGPRSLRRALERHTQILSALAAAHRRGVVHRDLKPSNLMFRRDPDAPGAEVVLGDFGVAHLPNAQGATGADAASAKKSVEAVGTLAYMAPEQRLGAGADPRSDLYAAAVVLYEMLTGTYPWPRDALLAGVRAAGDFRLAPMLMRAAPDDLSQMLTEHLDSLGAPDPERRPSTQEALEQARAMRAIAIAETTPS